MKNTSKLLSALVGSSLIFILGFSIVEQVVAQTCITAPSGLVSWLPGDGNADDIAGANHGTLQDGATFDTGIVGQAFIFDGTSSVTLNAPPNVPNQGSFTYDLWIYVVLYTNGAIDKGDGSYFVDRTDESLGLVDLKAVNDQFAFQVRYDDSTGIGGPIGGDIILDTWTHVAMVREYEVAFLLYVDGKLVDIYSDNGNPLTPYTPKLGHHDLSYLSGFEGLIDEFEIFDRALSQAEIQAIVTAGSAGKCKFTTVDIDIKPGSFPNSINLDSKGVIPVAILSSSTFDATTVVPESASLAGARVMVGKRGKFLCHEEDVNGDALFDLVCQFYTVDFMIEPSESVAVLEAETFDGTWIRGEDSVNIVP